MICGWEPAFNPTWCMQARLLASEVPAISAGVVSPTKHILSLPTFCPVRVSFGVPLPLLPAGATALVKLQTPAADELGFAKQLAVQEIGGTKCIVLQQDSSMGQISTVVLRGSTDQVRGRWLLACGCHMCALTSVMPAAVTASLLAAFLPALTNTRIAVAQHHFHQHHQRHHATV